MKRKGDMGVRELVMLGLTVIFVAALVYAYHEGINQALVNAVSQAFKN